VLQDTGQAEVAKLARKAARVIVHGCALHQHVTTLQITCMNAVAESRIPQCMGAKDPPQERSTGTCVVLRLMHRLFVYST